MKGVVAAVVPAVDVGADLGVEFLDRAVAAAVDGLAFDEGEPDFEQFIQEAWVGWSAGSGSRPARASSRGVTTAVRRSSVLSLALASVCQSAEHRGGPARWGSD